MGSRKSLLAALTSVLLLTGCSDRISQTPLLRPKTGNLVLAGRVRVVARLTGSTGDSVGTQVLDGASGVRVRLSGPNGFADSALTQSGGFEFRVNDPGVYRAAC